MTQRTDLTLARLIGITAYRHTTLSKFIRLGLLKPSVRTTDRGGISSLFGEPDFVAAKIICDLKYLGIHDSILLKVADELEQRGTLLVTTRAYIVIVDDQITILSAPPISYNVPVTVIYNTKFAIKAALGTS